ncbi:MAG: hypothetical protein K0R50_1, partial [Eubacterium sp.]|nr:hypothetical protein [Eubacterium sp.]
KKITASDFLALGLYTFAGFGLEVLLSMVLPNLLGIKSSEYSTTHHCIHWVLTCVLWGSITVFLLHLSKTKYSFDILKNNHVITPKGWFIAIIITVAAIMITTIVLKGFKPVTEYNGLVKFIFQNIYYLFEAALIVLTIIFGQRFGELITKKGNLPWGGLFLAMTWGLVHILLQDLNTGIYTFIMAILYGIVYVALNKNTKYSYILITFMFIL